MIYDELLKISFELQEKANYQVEMKDLDVLENTIQEIAKSWSGSNLGFHANIYYKDFSAPPAQANFSVEWGTLDPSFIDGTIGTWEKFTDDDIKSIIFNRAGNIDIEAFEDHSKKVISFFEDRKINILSILSTYLSKDNDNFIQSIKTQIENLNLFTQIDFINKMRPRGQIISRDTDAVAQGIKMAIHQIELARILAIRNVFQVCEKLANLAKNVGMHIQRKQQMIYSSCNTGTNVFLGHGRSPLWRELKDFVNDKLNLPWDEFNRVPVAGVTNISRLSEMLNNAAIAFIIMTAEDQQDNGTFHPRMNVIHEAGLFQGKLGFTKAIVLLEDGCEEFSNINGLGQIRFPKNNIKAIFEDIREVLEREKIIDISIKDES